MKTTLFDHPRLTVRLKTGTEGPTHDPYSYEELTVITPRGKVVLHEGLSVWLKHNDVKVDQPLNTPYEEYERWIREDVFKAVTGYSREQIARIARRLKERCPYCKVNSGRHHEPGFPGEHFEVCDNCNKIVGGYFNESEII